MATMDDIIRQMLEEQDTTPDVSEGLQIQPGLLGTTPANLSSDTLQSMQAKNQANTQQMAELGQQAVQNGMQAAQNVQSAQQASMNAAQNTLNQAVQQQQQREAQISNLIGGIVGSSIKKATSGNKQSTTSNANNGNDSNANNGNTISAGVGTDTNTPNTVDGVDINQKAPTTYSAGAKFQPGLLGDTPASTPTMTPANNAGQQALEHIGEKSQQVAQNMANMQQEANQQGAQAAQNLQAQRDSQMSSTEQQASQALQRQLQEENAWNSLFGKLLGMGIKSWT